jgi:hypothetical protein
MTTPDTTYVSYAVLYTRHAAAPAHSSWIQSDKQLQQRRNKTDAQVHFTQ